MAPNHKSILVVHIITPNSESIHQQQITNHAGHTVAETNSLSNDRAPTSVDGSVTGFSTIKSGAPSSSLERWGSINSLLRKLAYLHQTSIEAQQSKDLRPKKICIFYPILRRSNSKDHPVHNNLHFHCFISISKP